MMITKSMGIKQIKKTTATRFVFLLQYVVTIRYYRFYNNTVKLRK